MNQFDQQQPQKDEHHKDVQQNNSQLNDIGMNDMQEGNSQQNDIGTNYMQENNSQQNDIGTNYVQQGNSQQNDIGTNYVQQGNSQQNNLQQNYVQQSNTQQKDMWMYGMKQTILNQDIMPQEELSPKKILNNTGIALFILAAVVLGVQVLIEALAKSFTPAIVDTNWYVWAVTAISLVVIGFPVYYLLMKRIPDSPKGEVIKLKPAEFFVFFFICASAMYITNFFSSIITFVIALIKGEALINPAAEAILNGNFMITLIYAAVVAPVIEELIFRKLMLEKLRRFGDVPAILMTGFAFGLFHLNLSQFFYAAVLGFIFAYVVIRTNTVIYSILLHMMINFIATAMSPFVASGNLVIVIIIVAWAFTAITVGAILFILNIKKIRLEKTVPLVKTSTYFVNMGAILYTLICLVVIGLVTVI